MNKKKIKDIIETVAEIAVVAIIIIAIMLFVQAKLNNDTGSSDDEDVTVVGEESDGDSDDGDSNATGYLIQVNKKKNAVIIYQKNEDGSKDAVKVMRCTIGKDTPTGTFEIMESYTWSTADSVYWNKYSCRYSETFWFQSANYFAPYNSYISVDSYNAIGSEGDYDKEEGGCIKLTVADAKWIYDNCTEGTEVKIVKGKKSDELPLEFDDFTELPSYGGWDPTDPDNDNPWVNAANGTIAANTSNVYIERGSNVNYLSNVVALDTDGMNVTSEIDYTTIDSLVTGTYEVKYSYTCSDGTKIKNTVTYEVQDSLGPTIALKSDDEDDFTLKVSEKRSEKLNDEDYQEKVIKKMKKLVEVYDIDTEISSSRIVVVLPDELKLGNNQIKYSVEDDYGNVSYLTVTLVIELKDKDDEEETEEETTEEETEEETTVQQTTTKKTTKETTTKKKSESTTKSTTKQQTTKATTKAAETTKSTTTQAETNDSGSGSEEETDDNFGEQSAGD